MKASRRNFLAVLGGLGASGTLLHALPRPIGTSLRGLVQEDTATGQITPRETIPLVYCTDLFHPFNDPDDHVDLATVFAMPQFDIRAVILDQGILQAVKPGKIPLEQMMALTGRKVPYATGLGTALRHPRDDGRNQFSQYQGGVELILRVLRESRTPVTFMVVGSLRDVIAAYNREPGLFREKTSRLYFVGGNSDGGDLQWNPLLDPQACLGLMTADLPLYWCPTFARQDTLAGMAAGQLKPNPTRSYWNFRHSEIFSVLPTSLQNYFVYALARKDAATVNSLEYLNAPPEVKLRDALWKQTRYMWSTAAIYHAAGCELYSNQVSWAASDTPIPDFHRTQVFDFVPAEVTINRNLQATQRLSGSSLRQKVFRIRDLGSYQPAMLSSLRQRLSHMELAAEFPSPA